MKLVLEHMLPKRVRYAKVYFQAGAASLSVSIDGSTADWHATIGRKGEVELTDKEYARLRRTIPAEEVLDDDGDNVIVRSSAGYEESWRRPRWVLTRLRRSKGSGNWSEART